MSQCVPSWDMDENHTPPTLTLRAHSNPNSSCPDVPLLDYEVTELTWKNGQLAMHGLGPPRVPNKPPVAAAKYTWEKPRAGGTLESIVDQATTTCFPHPKTTAAASDLVPWFDHRATSASSSAAAAAAVTMDALVPCSTAGAAQEGISACVIGRSTRVGSCSEVEEEEKKKRARVAHVQEWSSRDNSDRRQLAIDTCERELGVRGLTSTSMENTSSGKHWTKVTAGDDHDSVSHSRSPIEAGEEENKKKPTGKSSISTKRCRAAAVHNQSERKRRDKINQRMKTLQKMVPNSSKTDKASMLDEVIEYLKVLQAQVQMMSRMNMPMPSMMFPMALQQLQLSMMAPMGMGMGMGMGMDMNTIGRPNAAGIPPILHPTAAFMPLTSWDGIGDRLVPHPTVMPDPMATFLSCQSQPMNMEAYNRMAALYQQLHQPPPPPPPPKNN